MEYNYPYGKKDCANDDGSLLDEQYAENCPMNNFFNIGNMGALQFGNYVGRTFGIYSNDYVSMNSQVGGC